METNWKKSLGIVLLTLGILLVIGGCIAAGIKGDYLWIIYGILIGLNICIIGLGYYYWNVIKRASKPGATWNSMIIMVTLFGLCLLYCLFVHDFSILGFDMKTFSVGILAIQLYHGIILVIKERKHIKRLSV